MVRVGQRYGWDEFISLDTLTSHAALLYPSDTLTLLVEVSGPENGAPYIHSGCVQVAVIADGDIHEDRSPEKILEKYNNLLCHFNFSRSSTTEFIP